MQDLQSFATGKIYNCRGKGSSENLKLGKTVSGGKKSVVQGEAKRNVSNKKKLRGDTSSDRRGTRSGSPKHGVNGVRIVMGKYNKKVKYRHYKITGSEKDMRNTEISGKGLMSRKEPARPTEKGKKKPSSDNWEKVHVFQ